MMFLFRVAISAAAFVSLGAAMSMAGGLATDRSGIERVQSGSDGDEQGGRSNEGRDPGAETRPRQKSRPGGAPQGEDDSDAREGNPVEPPGCIFRGRPLDLIV
ncbi:hypothetical protein [Hyphomicrobium methylovorum]|uniref:hypothetical protein n=1 Tax=Hyphomicrobium methylovorum TaxID=84 RepID=UPI0015E6AEBA|nr:hypothetical protein [Hyphomicrobium methylovorum]